MDFSYIKNLNFDQISSITSIIVSIVILIASFFQWHDITYDGEMKTKTWVKLLFTIAIVLLLISLLFIII